jgi:hypothetical protein
LNQDEKAMQSDIEMEFKKKILNLERFLNLEYAAF